MGVNLQMQGAVVSFILMMISRGYAQTGTKCNDLPIQQNPADGVCSSKTVKQTSMLRSLENCTVIEGHLQIMLLTRVSMKTGENLNYEDYSFPLLREITDYLMIYRVAKLNSLRNLFPNLAVIRGQKLFYNYALVVFDSFDLEELGLISLTVIARGGARVNKNKKLCYVDTIDWGRIATGVKPDTHHFVDNKDPSQCVNYCPKHCPSTFYDDVETKRCWTGKDCQKNLDCQCSSNVSCMDDGKCCHHYCLGGCTGTEPHQCMACKGVVFNGTCQPGCPPGTYKYVNRRCLMAKECLNLRNRTDTLDGSKAMLLLRAKTPECVMSCPKGYTVATEGHWKDMECVKCRDFCPKECNGTEVNSIQQAQGLHGCSKIIGNLIIQIMERTTVAEELEKNLGDIREVTGQLTIRRSYPLTNLHFFKTLETIRGDQLNHQGQSLIIMDNKNLQELFPEENMKRMKVKRGKVSFHSNRQLCKYQIDEFVSYLNLSEPPTDTDISPNTNGDGRPCMEQELKLEVKLIFHNTAILVWDKDQGDERNLLTYMINYKEVDKKTVDIHRGRDACSDEVWTIKEQQPTKNAEDSQVGVLSKLKPFTMYAVYVQAYTLSTATHSAVTHVQTFITDPYYPSEPRDLKVTANNPRELHVSWKEPKYPNGNVTHYKVAYLKQNINPESYEQRNYCKEPIQTRKEMSHEKVDNNEEIKSNISGSCCACPKSKKKLEEEARKQEIEVYFENYLQNNIYCKRYDELPEEVAIDAFDFDLNQLANEDALTNQSHKRPTNASHWWMNELNKTLKQRKQEINSQSYKITEMLKQHKLENDSHIYEDPSIGLVEVLDLEVILPNLEPFVEYIIEVQACHDTNVEKLSKTKLCSNREIIAGRTQAEWKSDRINETTITYETIANATDIVIVKWEPPPKPNGLILMYNIFYKRARSSQQNIVPQQVCIRQSDYRMYNGCRLTGLEPGNWTFWINAVSLAGNSSETNKHYFNIPNPPGEDNSNYIFIITIIIVIPLVIFLIVVVLWFVIKYKIRHEDMTVISPNVNYVPSEQMYIMDGWEVERDKIKLVRELGQGSFGMVYEGTALGLGDDPEKEIRVAVKTVNDRASFNDKREFLKEATTMKAFDCYHVVKLRGVVSHGQPALVIMELMAQGDLKNYLREHRPDEHERPGVSAPCLLDILQMAGEIADGMAYLAAKKFVHRDLAARNCMVDEDKTVKIGDFGMTRDIYETDYYRKGGKGMLPVRWMAPESLRDGVFTTMSDVWSYGVVMWEMVTLAAQPYQGLSNEEVVKFISSGSTMEMPDNCPDEMAHLMQRCWARKPKSRPTFMDIIEYLLPNLNSRFDKVSYFFNDGGGPVEGGRGGNLEPPPNDDDAEDEEGDGAEGGEDEDFSDSASSLGGASALPLSGSSDHDYPLDCIQVSRPYGRDHNGVLGKGEKNSFYQFNEVPESMDGNTSRDSNLDGSLESESFISNVIDDRGKSDSNRSFIRGDYHSVPHTTIPHSLSIPNSSQRNGDGPVAGPDTGVIELQPLISSDKLAATAPFSLPSPNSDQSKAVTASKYPGYQRVPLGGDNYYSAPNNSQPSHQKPQLSSAYPLTQARMDRPVPHNRPGTSASRPSQSMGASSSSPSSSSPPPLLPPAIAAPPSRPSLRLPVLNQAPGGGFRRVPLFNSGSRDMNTSQRTAYPHQLPSASDSQNSPGTNLVQSEEQSPSNDSPLIAHSSTSPLQGATGSTSSEGSKDSSKSSDNFSQMNGLTNGFVWHRTANC